MNNQWVTEQNKEEIGQFIKSYGNGNTNKIQ